MEAGDAVLGDVGETMMREFRDFSIGILAFLLAVLVLSALNDRLQVQVNGHSWNIKIGGKP